MALANGIHFVKIVASPLTGWRDCSNQFNRANTLPEMVTAVLEDWYPGENDADTREEAIDMALNMVQAQFSQIDYNNVRPMTVEADPEEIAFNAEIGFYEPEERMDRDWCFGVGLKPPHRMYELQPLAMGYDEVVERLEFAEKHGHHTGLARDELQKAKAALEEAHGGLLQTFKSFRDFPSVPTMIMSGAQMAAACDEHRDDILLNTLFGRTDNLSRRLAGLTPVRP